MERGTSRSGQIVAELRHRIVTGELAPGDRVPSTREITRRWGVAMATATKALTQLRHEGLVRAVPGVGTVVATGTGSAPRPAAARPGGPRPRQRRGDEQAASTRIVAAAIAVADAEGLTSVSMRRVAAELGMATMSLYRYVTDKDDLLAQMMDAAFAEQPLPDEPPEGWRDRLELAARTLWAMFRRHPWLAPALSVTRPQPLPNALPFTEWMLGSLADRLDVQTILTIHLTLFNWVRATAISMEAEAEAEALSGLDAEEWMDGQEPALREIFATGRFPLFERLNTEGYDFDLDGLFEFGLQRLLDGLAVFVGEAPR
ncbi:TetR/AcrR family transcriptional regulator C-terminal domain-containing protein [Actinoallomurus iriomotensis]|uniref:GntR family transcriptional regulator n=1 Tax=Actinoallomurus iriomotensis TaxID=478107 RepID=A0A9W6RV23_9ACTN|nr:TetR/AcrR family transcriptional regulator C-terminal domain-containing protein [Actinoallomurus iriomotensis]GLY80642.1 GntR family transcriptional regulator [Actinoallomurus iriomotensis]